MNESRPHWCPAYIGLGSNLDDPVARVNRAFSQLADIDDTQLIERSSLYLSAPLGPADQPDYVNAVAALLTRRSPLQLLRELQSIEASQGRRRSGERWGARTLDLDLLVFGLQHIDNATLTVPHPRIAERNFVLLPLSDVAPDLIVPGLGALRTLIADNDNSVPTLERI